MFGAIEVSGHHEEACGLMERVLFADLDEVMDSVGGLDIRFWDEG